MENYSNLPNDSVSWGRSVSSQAEYLLSKAEVIQNGVNVSDRSGSGSLAALESQVRELGFRVSQSVTLPRLSVLANSNSPSWQGEVVGFIRPDWAVVENRDRPRSALLTFSTNVSASSSASFYSGFTELSAPGFPGLPDPLMRRYSSVGTSAPAPGNWGLNDFISFSIGVIFPPGRADISLSLLYSAHGPMGNATIRWDDTTFTMAYGGLL